MKKNTKYIIQAKAGNKEAMAKLLDENIALIWSMVNRLKDRGIETEDLFQTGCMAFIKGINNFNVEFDVELSTYLVPVILGDLKKLIRDDKPIKVSRGVKELYIKILETGKAYVLLNGTEPSIDYIANELQISREDIVFAMESATPLKSLDDKESVNDEVNILLKDKISNKKDEAEAIINKVAIQELLKNVDVESRKIIMLRYYKEKTQTEVSKILGITQVQVSRLEKKILSTMKYALNGG